MKTKKTRPITDKEDDSEPTMRQYSSSGGGSWRDFVSDRLNRIEEDIRKLTGGAFAAFLFLLATYGAGYAFLDSKLTKMDEKLNKIITSIAVIESRK